MIERVGIILTAGACEKKSTVWSSYGTREVDQKGNVVSRRRIEPDLEGKIRAHPALFDLVKKRLDRLIVTGGQSAYGEGVATHYANYLNRKRKAFKPDSPEVVSVITGIETGSDLRATADLLQKDDEVVIYSSRFHLRRRASNTLRILGFKVIKEPSEDKLKKKDRRYKKIINGVLNPWFVFKQTLRGLAIDLLPQSKAEQLARKQRAD